MKTPEYQLKAGAKYDKENTRSYTLKLNKKTDQDLIILLDHSENKQAIIKSALRSFNKKSAWPGDLQTETGPAGDEEKKHLNTT